MAEKTTSVWEELRKPFLKEAVGLLPKVSCYNCAQATKTAKSGLDKHCDRHTMSKCDACGNYLSEAHIHLDFVGHAAVTDRLNTVVGPENWTWEPLALDERGLPALDAKGNLWIKLTVLGTTRIGYGDGSTSMKELIGDALRNAAMRFGVALDLWTREELESTIGQPELKNEKPSAATSPAPAPSSPKNELIPPALLTDLRMALRDAGYTGEAASGYCTMIIGKDKPTTVDEVKKLLTSLTAEPF